MEEQFSRSAIILGVDAIEKLKNCRIAVFGVGGVGGFAVEALARAGVGTIDIIDNDKVSLSNINRQIIALHSTVGMYKVDVAEKRIKDINPLCNVNVHKFFYLPETADLLDFSDYDYIVDAVDTVTAKVDIICRAKDADVPVISAMGAGNKTNPLKFSVADIYKTSVCPLARVMRAELRKRKIKNVKTVFSTEEPAKSKYSSEVIKGNRIAPGSLPFVVSVAGLILAGEVIKDLINFEG